MLSAMAVRELEQDPLREAAQLSSRAKARSAGVDGPPS